MCRADPVAPGTQHSPVGRDQTPYGPAQNRRCLTTIGKFLARYFPAPSSLVQSLQQQQRPLLPRAVVGFIEDDGVIEPRTVDATPVGTNDLTELNDATADGTEPAVPEGDWTVARVSAADVRRVGGPDSGSAHGTVDEPISVADEMVSAAADDPFPMEEPARSNYIICFLPSLRVSSKKSFDS